MDESEEPVWPHDTRGARAFASAFMDSIDEISATMARVRNQHPVIGPLLQELPEGLRASAETGRAMMQCIFEGKWEAYAAQLRELGLRYLELGLSFQDWYEQSTAWSFTMTPILVKRLAGDPALLVEALASMQQFINVSMAVLGEAYVEGSEARVEASQKEVERWGAIFRHVAWGVLVVSPDLRIHAANPAFCQLCGSDPIGKDLSTFYAPGELARARSTIRPEDRAAGHVTYEANLLDRNGLPYPTLVDAARLPLDPDEGERWVLNIIDLTERKKAEALQKRGAELESENRRIQEASRLKTEFLANMSHELRTPLNSIIGFAELLHMQQVGELEPKQHEFVGDILTSGRHLLRLINDVLDLSKVESGTMLFRPEPLDVAAIVDEVLGVLRSQSQERSIRIESAIADDIGAVTLDPVRLKQVLYNFLSNALKFGPPGTRVEVRVKSDGPSSFRIEVQDQGPGVPREQQHRLFMEFEQLDTGRGKTHAGTGLGLALTRRLVEAQGGSVGVESELGQGATFHATLPRRAATTALPQPRRIDGASPRAPRILVVEDDPQDQDRIVSMLIAAGYAVDTAATGAQALRACRARSYDAITLGLVLPDGGGLEIVSAIRGTTCNRESPVIVLSVVSEELTRGFLVHDVLPKPVSGDALLASLSRAQVVAPGRGPVLVVDDDESSAKLMAETLHQLGFRPLVANNGEAALAKAAETTPAAVVLDLVMPELDGFGFLRRFRSEPAWSKVPVFVWTMKDLSQTEHASLAKNAEAVLVKDGRGGSLLDTMRALLAEEGHTPERGTR